MPNPKGSPDNLQPFTTNRDEPLVGKLTVRVAESMMVKLKSIDNHPEFVREAIAEALRKLESKEENKSQ